jgi:hypothetical protein
MALGFRDVPFFARVFRQFVHLRLTRPDLFAQPHTPGLQTAWGFYDHRRFLRILMITFRKFQNAHGGMPDIVHPRTFSEKVLRQKFFGTLPLPEAGNKLLTHRFIPDDLDGVRAVPIVYHSTDPCLPPDDALPPGSYFLKANHGSDMFRPMQWPPSEGTRAELDALCANWLSRNFGYWQGEWWYSGCTREILIEPNISPEASATSWCYAVLGGKIGYISLIRKVNGETQVTRLDPDHRPLPHQPENRTRITEFDDHGLKDRMAEAALAIARPFPLVRVDLYVTEAREIFLGEVTFAPGDGRTSFPPEFDLEMGALVTGIR